mgnify:CR=1 FL=1
MVGRPHLYPFSLLLTVSPLSPPPPFFFFSFLFFSFLFFYSFLFFSFRFFLILASGSERTEPRGASDPYKKLGFSQPHDPAAEFMQPPGVLCLDNMAFFARSHPEPYARVVLEQLSKAEEYACPFAKASARLVELLLSLLDVGNEGISS